MVDVGGEVVVPPVVVVGVVVVVPPVSVVDLPLRGFVRRSMSYCPPVTLGATATPATTIAIPIAMALKVENSLLTVLPPQTKSGEQNRTETLKIR
ncbi:hypothetical protein GCM10023264_08180 [Sphingomonas daechungensis]